MSIQSGTVEERIALLFQRCVTRPPTGEETALLAHYFTRQKERFESKVLDATKVAGVGEADPNSRAAWTSLARSLLNLDEAITRH